MVDILISNELARQFAYDCFDVIIRDIKAKEAKKERNISDSSPENRFAERGESDE